MILPTAPGLVVASATLTGRADPDPSNNTSTITIDVDEPKAELFFGDWPRSLTIPRRAGCAGRGGRAGDGVAASSVNWSRPGGGSAARSRGWRHEQVAANWVTWGAASRNGRTARRRRDQAGKHTRRRVGPGPRAHGPRSGLSCGRPSPFEPLALTGIQPSAASRSATSANDESRCRTRTEELTRLRDLARPFVEVGERVPEAQVELLDALHVVGLAGRASRSPPAGGRRRPGRRRARCGPR